MNYILKGSGSEHTDICWWNEGKVAKLLRLTLANLYVYYLIYVVASTLGAAFNPVKHNSNEIFLYINSKLYTQIGKRYPTYYIYPKK